MAGEDEKLLAHRNAMEAQLVLRAWRDPAFREALVRDPKGTLAKELGADFPQGVEIEVLQETDAKKYLVLPQALSGDLSAEELDRVSGGIRLNSPTTLAGIRDGYYSLLLSAQLSRKL